MAELHWTQENVFADHNRNVVVRNGPGIYEVPDEVVDEYLNYAGWERPEDVEGDVEEAGGRDDARMATENVAREENETSVPDSPSGEGSGATESAATENVAGSEESADADAQTGAESGAEASGGTAEAQGADAAADAEGGTTAANADAEDAAAGAEDADAAGAPFDPSEYTVGEIEDELESGSYDDDALDALAATEADGKDRETAHDAIEGARE